MSNCKILYVCQEISPYVPETEMSVLCRALSQGMQERGNEIRTFMPRYGCINERRNQLHEVIRLSGMNLIINDNDHQLIIKVASIPSARIQIYFIDNDDYFSRKAMLTDAAGNYFSDNDERAMFFARGALEIVRKLRWQPTIVHCHGWLSCLVPLYLKYVFADDPIFQNVKIVMSLYDDSFPGELDAAMAAKVTMEGVPSNVLEDIAKPTYENLIKMIVGVVDGIVVEAESLPPTISETIGNSGKPVLGRQDKSNSQYLDNYQKFYEELL